MEIKKAGILDISKTNQIIVDNRKLFDNPIFTKGVPPAYPTWHGLKRIIKYCYAMLHPRHCIFFLMDGKKVAGAAVLVNNNFIDGFFINEEYRGKGHGRVLMEYVFDFVRKNFSAMEVRVEDANDNAKKFYEACGFEHSADIMRRNF